MDDDELVAAMGRLTPAQAARVLEAAPSLQDKTRLLWAMDRPKRADVLDRVPAGVFAALVQNMEDRNRYLLGCISIQGFRQVLDLCSPAQKYYWVALANSFSDEAANLLLLSIPIRDLAEMLMTVRDFRDHLDALADYEPQGLSQPLPVTDPALKRVLETFIDLEEESFTDLIKCALEIRTYEMEHPEEAEIRFEPIVLKELGSIPLPPLRKPIPTALALESNPQESGLPVPTTAHLPQRVSWSNSLASLGDERRAQVQRQFLRLVQQEIEGLGGSFAEADIQRAMARARFYVQAGLAHLSSDDQEKAVQVLDALGAEEVSRAGMAVVEGFRQVAVRLLAFRALLDRKQVSLLESLCRPDVGVDETTGEVPVVYIREGGTGRLMGSTALADLPEALSDIADWVAVSRRLDRQQVEVAVASEHGGADAAAAALVIALAIYGRWDLGLADLDDVIEFKARHFDATMGRIRPEVRETLLAAAREWGGGDAERVEYVLMRAVDRLEGFLFETAELTVKSCRGRVWISQHAKGRRRRPHEEE